MHHRDKDILAVDCHVIDLSKIVHITPITKDNWGAGFTIHYIVHAKVEIWIIHADIDDDEYAKLSSMREIVISEWRKYKDECRG